MCSSAPPIGANNCATLAAASPESQSGQLPANRKVIRPGTSRERSAILSPWRLHRCSPSFCGIARASRSSGPRRRASSASWRRRAGCASPTIGTSGAGRSKTPMRSGWTSPFARVRSDPPAERVLGRREMPAARWFPGARVSYAEHIFRGERDDDVAITHASELRLPAQMTRAKTRNLRLTAIRSLFTVASLRHPEHGVRGVSGGGAGGESAGPGCTVPFDPASASSRSRPSSSRARAVRSGPRAVGSPGSRSP